MRVAMVSEHASPLAVLGGVDAGGQNVHVAALAMAMARRGVEVVVHTRRDNPELPHRVMMAPRLWVEHVDAGPPWPIAKDDMYPYMPEFGERLAESWSEDRPDVVHSHFWMSGTAASEAGRRLSIPVVQTFHALGIVKRRYQGEADTSPPGRIAVERRLCRSLDHIIATCSDEVFELVRMGAELDRISVIPCGVDLRLFTPEGPTVARTPGRYRIVVVSRLVRRKGIEDAIAALAHVPDAELLVAGGPDAADLAEDSEARRLCRLAAALGVADRVRLLGRLARGEVPMLLRSADVVVSVPWYEPFGIVPVEAMACGVPVVASAVGGQVDSVVDGVTGVHIPPQSPDRLAEVLRSLLPDEATRRRMGAQGAARARARFGWDRIAMSSLQAYRRVLDERIARAGEAAR